MLQQHLDLLLIETGSSQQPFEGFIADRVVMRNQGRTDFGRRGQALVLS